MDEIRVAGGKAILVINDVTDLSQFEPALAIFSPELELTSDTTAKAIWPMEDHIWWPEGSPVRYQHGMGYYHETQPGGAAYGRHAI